ncbi:Mucin 2 precursor [hydrothermal vent metagenome]|uniref:Mucin 2 n=1 Tax=hydrothermal vent metagenome TaxID=652676 RepID=A0A3B0ZXI3_9ZZZZ
MEINKKTRTQLRLQSFSFVALVIVITGLLIQVSRQYDIEFDWTATGRHSLNEVSIKVVEKIESPVKITSYATSDALSEVRTEILDLINRYQKLSDKIEIDFIDPRLAPDKIRELGIRYNGEMIIEYQGRSENLQDFTEIGVTNALQRLLRNNDRHILFVSGHGERNPVGQANHDLSIFTENLSNKGFQVAPLDLSKTLAVPENTSVLVIASPQLEYLPGETQIIKDYVANGGNLLWLIEPNKSDKLSALADYLKISITKGIVVDLDMSLLGNEPTMVLGQYQQHAITENVQSIQTLYPKVIGIEIAAQEGWTIDPILQSMPRSWLETGKMEGTIKFDPPLDKPGPIVFGYAMTRSITENPDKTSDQTTSAKTKKQRIVIIGDGDFLSNTYLGTQGNMAMGESIFNWLAHDDNFIDIPAAIAPDSKVSAEPYQLIIIAVLIMILLPILLIGSGVIIWLKRRKK